MKQSYLSKEKKSIDLIIIDYAQLIGVPKTVLPRLKMITIIQRLKELSKKLNIPIIVLSHLSKDLEERADKLLFLENYMKLVDLEY